MESILKHIHSYWAYIVVIVTTIATVNFIIGAILKKEYQPKDFRLALLTLIATHLQFLFGMILYFTSSRIQWFNDDVSVKDIMKNADLRLYHIEHPTVMLLAAVLITIGYSKHKKQLVSGPKFKFLTIFYTLALLLILSRIPWKVWF